MQRVALTPHRKAQMTSRCVCRPPSTCATRGASSTDANAQRKCVRPYAGRLSGGTRHAASPSWPRPPRSWLSGERGRRQWACSTGRATSRLARAPRRRRPRARRSRMRRPQCVQRPRRMARPTTTGWRTPSSTATQRLQLPRRRYSDHTHATFNSSCVGSVRAKWAGATPRGAKCPHRSATSTATSVRPSDTSASSRSGCGVRPCWREWRQHGGSG